MGTPVIHAEPRRDAPPTLADLAAEHDRVAEGGREKSVKHGRVAPKEPLEDTADKLLTAEEAGIFLSLKTSTIRRLTHKRELPCVRPTGRRAVRYRLRDLEALLRLRSQPARANGGRRRCAAPGEASPPHPEAPADGA